MKNILLSAVLSMFCVVASAQSSRVVQGRVVDEKGTPIAGATITASGFSTTFTSDGKGNFRAEIPSSVNRLTAVAPQYDSSTETIEGLFVLIRLKYDPNAEKRRAEVAAKAVESARRDSLLARQKAYADSVAATQSVLAAQQKARKKEAYRRKIAAYDEKYRNHGLVHEVSLAYGYQVDKGKVIYKTLGTIPYGDQIPLTLTYTIGWRFNYLVSLGLGVGVLYDVRCMDAKGDSYASMYEDFKSHQIDVPVFLNAKLYFIPAEVQPFVSVSGGLYALTLNGYIDGGLGVNIRMKKSFAMNISANLSTTPWPYFSDSDSKCGYRMSLTPGVKVGVNF